MEESYLGEIRWFTGSRIPVGWAACDGSFIAVSSNQPLFSVLDTTYGGDGVNYFALPDLRGCVAAGWSTMWPLASKAGRETVGLSSSNLPSHTHPANAASPTGSAPIADPNGNVWAGNSKVGQFISGNASDLYMNFEAIGAAGGNEPHENMPPFLVIGFIICTSGVFPAQA